jgi:lipoprotein-releasing system ATP-binding protein
MNLEACLSCEGVERYLGEEEERVHALRGVSLDIETGSVHAVVGPSGCGKSSLLYILGLLDLPDAGRVSIDSEPVAELSDDELAHKRSKFIGFIFQFHFLMEDFTAQENVMIPMRKLGQLSDARMRERAADLLESVGLGDKLRRPSRHLSGGEQQRVAIARALANDPKIILADEPTGNLDTANSERAFELLQKLVHGRGKALLLATHNPAIAEACESTTLGPRIYKDGALNFFVRTRPARCYCVSVTTVGKRKVISPAKLFAAPTSELTRPSGEKRDQTCSAADRHQHHRLQNLELILRSL